MNKIGRYEVIEELGRGTAGTVYKAFDPTIRRLVAIKVLSLPASPSHGSSGAISAKDPLLEARMAGCLAHPHIVTIYDAVTDEESKLHYIVIEYVEGRTLEHILAENPLPPTSQALNWVRQIAEALDYAHQRQIVHRDLKPANILITEKGQIKITDFGIARKASLEATVSTMAMAGTPSYMSPEQITGVKLDGRSDLFSLGIILYEMLVGQRPFAGELATVMFKTVYEDIPPPRKLKQDIRPEIEEVVMRCLAKDPRQRYSTAGELLADLSRAETSSATPGRAADKAEGKPTDGHQLDVAETVAGSPTLFRPRQKIVWGALAAAVLLGAAGAFVYHRIRTLTAPVPPPSPWSITAPPPPSSVWETNPFAASRGSAPSNEAASGARRQTRFTEPPPVHASALASTPGNRALPPSAQPTSGATPTESAAAPVAPVGPSVSPSPAEAPEDQGKRIIRLICQYPFAKGTLTLMHGNKVLSRWELKGKKKRRILFLGGGYQGRLSETIALPAALRQITVHVSSSRGKRIFRKTVPLQFNTASPSKPTLSLVINDGHLRARWLGVSKTSR